MNSLARALLGVALGSCLTLFIHPLSRPFMTGLVPRPAEAKEIRDISGPESGQMKAPLSVADAGLWMELGCARLDSEKPLSTRELQDLTRIALYVESDKNLREFGNAFWPQMAAIFLNRLGQKEEAQKAWIRAAKGQRWKDYQSARLLDQADKIRPENGPMAWHLAGLYYQRRSEGVGSAILEYARDLLEDKDLKSKEDVELRYYTLRNAGLLASGARSIDIFRYAIPIADLASQPKDAAPITDKADKEKARGVFYAALNHLGQTDWAVEAKGTYGEIYTRPVVTAPFRPTQTAVGYSTLSIFTATLPGALLIIGALGAVLWPLGLFVLRYSDDHQSFSWLPIAVFGLVLAVGVIALTLPVLAGVVLLLCALFLGFTPKNERSRLPSDLGPFFAWTVAILSVLFTVALVGFLASLSTPAQLLFPSILGTRPTQLGSTLSLALIGLAAMIFAMLLLVAPMWAFGRRVRTPFVLGLAFKNFGTALLTLGLAGTVLLGPACVFADSKAREDLKELVGNEPAHYFKEFQ